MSMAVASNWACGHHFGESRLRILEPLYFNFPRTPPFFSKFRGVPEKIVTLLHMGGTELAYNRFIRRSELFASNLTSAQFLCTFFGNFRGVSEKIATRLHMAVTELAL